MTAAAVMMTPREAALAEEAAQKAALDRIAANTYPIRPLFKSALSAGAAGPPGAGGAAAAGPDREAEAAALAQNPNATRPLGRGQRRHAARANLPNAQQMKEKYGEITMLDFPQFTKERLPA